MDISIFYIGTYVYIHTYILTNEVENIHIACAAYIYRYYGIITRSVNSIFFRGVELCFYLQRINNRKCKFVVKIKWYNSINWYSFGTYLPIFST